MATASASRSSAAPPLQACSRRNAQGFASANRSNTLTDLRVIAGESTAVTLRPSARPHLRGTVVVHTSASRSSLPRSASCGTQFRDRGDRKDRLCRINGFRSRNVGDPVPLFQHHATVLHEDEDRSRNVQPFHLREHGPVDERFELPRVDDGSRARAAASVAAPAIMKTRKAAPRANLLNHCDTMLHESICETSLGYPVLNSRAALRSGVSRDVALA